MANESISVDDDCTNTECNEDNITFLENNIMEEQTHLLDYRSMELSERRKRYREETNENLNDWHQVSKRPGKRVRSQQNLEGDLIQICVRSSQVLPKQFALAKLLRDNKIIDITKVKYVNNYKIYITFNKESSAESFLTCTFFSNLGWRCQKTSELGISYGIIKNMDLDLSDEELLDNLRSDVEIMSIKRLNRRHEGKWVVSESVKLMFKGSSLPPYVYILGLRIRVEPYIYPVTQCSNCWRYGHTAKFCPSNKIICPKCTGNHPNCEVTFFKCVNCSGNHMALNKICPVYKKERRIRDLMSEYNCSYQKALTIYVPPSPVLSTKSYDDLIDMQHKHIYTSTLLIDSPLNIEEQRADRINSEPLNTNNLTVNKTTLKKKKKKKQQNQEEENIILETNETRVNDIDNESNVDDSGGNNKKSFDSGLIDKIKVVIFKNNLNLNSKIKEIVQIIIEYITVVVIDFCSDLSRVKWLFNNLSNNG